MTEGEAADFLAGATWGAEVDIGTADRKIALPEGNTWSPDEDSGVNAAGIGFDPTLTYNCFGGELRTKPCGSPAELHKLILDIADLVIPGESRVLPPFPSVIHVHIRVPQLVDRPDILRHLLVYGEQWDEKLQAELYKPFIISRKFSHDGPALTLTKSMVQTDYATFSSRYSCELPWHFCTVK